MMKKEEIKNPDSCLNRSEDEEFVFVLTSRDVCAPLAIRAWIEARLVTGKNKSTDQQLREASIIATSMEIQREYRASLKQNRNCVACGSPVVIPGFDTCGKGRFDVCWKKAND